MGTEVVLVSLPVTQWWSACKQTHTHTGTVFRGPGPGPGPGADTWVVCGFCRELLQVLKSSVNVMKPVTMVTTVILWLM